MDLVHLHLMLNHAPVLGVIFGFLVLLAGTVSRSKAIAGVGLGLLIVAGILAIPVYLTGEPAEEIVEGLPGISETVIGQHESAAGFSLALAIASGLIAIVTLAFFRFRSPRTQSYLVVASLLISLITGTSMIRTANLGGQIRHTEIRTASPNESPGNETKTTEHSRSEKDRDD